MTDGRSYRIPMQFKFLRFIGGEWKCVIHHMKFMKKFSCTFFVVGAGPFISDSCGMNSWQHLLRIYYLVSCLIQPMYEFIQRTMSHPLHTGILKLLFKKGDLMQIIVMLVNWNRRQIMVTMSRIPSYHHSMCVQSQKTSHYWCNFSWSFLCIDHFTDTYAHQVDWQ